MMNGDIALTWLAEQGATFALPEGRDKRPLYKNWQNQPFDVAKAIAHANSDGNVGLLTGTHSGGIIALDIDRDYRAVVESLGPYANTVKVQRANAIDRGKLLYRVDFPVTSKSWKPNGEGSPWAELLSNGHHALIPPSQFEGGDYVLVDQHTGIATLTADDLALVWYKATEGREKLLRPSTEPRRGNALTPSKTIAKRWYWRLGLPSKFLIIMASPQR